MINTIRCIAFAGIACAGLVGGAASAQDINTFRAQHGLPALTSSAALAGAAYSHAASMAARNSLDHSGFKARAMMSHGTSAENVSYGCDTEACAIAQWARSSGHRANMLRGDVQHYGIASATSASGRKYWALELGGDSQRVIMVRGGRGGKRTAQAHMWGAPIGRDLGIER